MRLISKIKEHFKRKNIIKEIKENIEKFIKEKDEERFMKQNRNETNNSDEDMKQDSKLDIMVV